MCVQYAVQRDSVTQVVSWEKIGENIRRAEWKKRWQADYKVLYAAGNEDKKEAVQLERNQKGGEKTGAEMAGAKGVKAALSHMFVTGKHKTNQKI